VVLIQWITGTSHFLVHWISYQTCLGPPEFQASVRKLLSDEELALLIDYLAYNPAAGDLIPGTGGVRKLRWSLSAVASAAAQG
jgi:hypothetical protein